MTLKYTQLLGVLDALKTAGYTRQVSASVLNKTIMECIGPSKYTIDRVKEALKTGELLFELNVNMWEFPEERARRLAEEENIMGALLVAEPEPTK